MHNEEGEVCFLIKKIQLIKEDIDSNKSQFFSW